MLISPDLCVKYPLNKPDLRGTCGDFVVVLVVVKRNSRMEYSLNSILECLLVNTPLQVTIHYNLYMLSYVLGTSSWYLHVLQESLHFPGCVHRFNRNRFSTPWFVFMSSPSLQKSQTSSNAHQQSTTNVLEARSFRAVGDLVLNCNRMGKKGSDQIYKSCTE